MRTASAIIAASAVAFPAFGDTLTVSLVNPSSTTISPGEAFSFDIRVKLDPVVGSPAMGAGTYGYEPGKVKCFERMYMSLFADTPGYWLKVKFAPPIVQYLSGVPSFSEWGIQGLHPTNYLNGSQTLESDILLMTITWTPAQYTPGTVTFAPAFIIPNYDWGRVWITPDSNPEGLTVGFWTWTGSPIQVEVLSGAACVADCDTSGSLDIEDFICFQTYFATGALAADCDADGVLLIDDFICFQTAFVLGC
jgi:hypothetical protein